MEIYDVIIIGGGIAANTAAIYTARAKLNPLVIMGPELDQLSWTSTVENFPGFPEGILGPDLTKNSRKQAQKFGAKYIEGLVESFNIKKKFFEVVLNGGKKYNARTVIIATGASARKLGISGEDKYFGKGVSTCAVCDAALYRERTVVVVGGGDSAMEEALALYKFAKKIIIVHRKETFKASKIMQHRVLDLKDKISVVWNTEIKEVTGDGKFVTGIKTFNTKTNKAGEIKCDGVFLAIGHIPNTKIFSGKVNLDEHGYVITDKKAKTNIEGVYAAGDVQDPVFKQAITSAGSGCQAAIQAERYIEDLKAKEEY